MWLSNEILRWRPQAVSFTNGGEVFLRSYEILEHAEALLSTSTNNFQLTDCIANLKRCVNHRLKLLNDVYDFKNIFKNKKPARLIDQLAYFGLVKPFMLEKLIIIRNELEHEDKVPPSKERCYEFAEFTWYFLKSTDNLANKIPHGIILFPLTDIDRKHYWLSSDEFYLLQNPVELRGWIKPGDISEIQRPDWLYLDDVTLSSRSKFIESLENSEAELKYDAEIGGRGQFPDDIYIIGNLHITEDLFLPLCQLYFSTSL